MLEPTLAKKEILQNLAQFGLKREKGNSKIFDNEKGIALLIEVPEKLFCLINNIIALLELQKTWQKKYPNKKITSISFIQGIDSDFSETPVDGHNDTFCFLIFYSNQ